MHFHVGIFQHFDVDIYTTPKEKEMGMTFIFGHLCYEDTDACDMYESKGKRQC